MYMAFSTTVGSVTAGVGSIAAGTFLSVTQGWSFTVFGLVVSGFPLIFMTSFVLRLVVTFTLIPRIKLSGAIAEEDRPFLLPLFFEAVPGINRLVRQRGKPSPHSRE